MFELAKNIHSKMCNVKKKTPINRGFSSDSYILLDSELNIIILFGGRELYYVKKVFR